MGYLDQFVASVSFNVEKVVEFRKQSVWKSVLYVFVFVGVTGGIYAFLTWHPSLSLLRETWIYYGVDMADETGLRFSHALMRYLIILFDLILHFVLISAMAYAGSKGYQTIEEVTYKEAWNVTAYGISAPILVRLIVRGMGLTVPMMTFFYWGAMMLFSMMCLKKMVHLEK